MGINSLVKPLSPTILASTGVKLVELWNGLLHGMCLPGTANFLEGSGPGAAPIQLQPTCTAPWWPGHLPLRNVHFFQPKGEENKNHFFLF